VLGFNGRAVRTARDYRDAVAAVQRRTRCLVQDVASFWWDEFPMPDEDGNGTSFGKFANPPRALRYPFINLLAGAGAALGRVIPPRAMPTLRRAFYRATQGWQLTRSLTASRTGDRR
jgi:hypothetical protein